MSVREAWTVTLLLLAGALGLAAFCGAGYLACVLLTVPVTAAYSFRPLRTKRLPFAANATIATPRGLLLVLAGWAVGGGLWRPEAWILGGLAWVYVFGASTTKDFADAAGDQATGCVTLPILLGPRRAAWFVAPFLVAPYLSYPLLAAAGALPGGVGPWALLGLPLAAIGGAAGALLVRDPAPPASGRPHPAWGLMYMQYTLSHLGAAALFVVLAR